MQMLPWGNRFECQTREKRRVQSAKVKEDKAV